MASASAPTPDSAAPYVILLHGLWMRGFAMTVLAHRLHEAGFGVEPFEYLSVAAPVDETLERLRATMRRHAGEVHLVGHSLGGVLALLACSGRDDLPPGRVVCLGSPLSGSAAARGLAGFGGAWLLGHSRELLEHGIRHWDGPRVVGSIAGRLPLGLGAALGRFGADNDGTVAVTETRLPGIADRCVVEASHTGLLFSTVAAAASVHFLRDGHFAAGDSVPGATADSHPVP